MLRWLPAPILGLLTFLALAVGTVFWCIPLYTFALLRLLSPVKAWRHLWADLANKMAENWVGSNVLIMSIMLPNRWQIESLPELKYKGWYFVVSNHQTWVDILVLQFVFHRKVPFLRFFTKDTLKYLPFIGLACWVLDCPMVKRYSPKTLAKKPHLRGRDREMTIKRCQLYLRKPSSISNFLEGTRFTAEKHARQKSPYKHLLMPKTGGFALAIQGMQPHIKSFINVTITYPHGAKNFLQLLCGKAVDVSIKVEEVMIPPHFLVGDYGQDDAFREEIKEWLHQIWLAKDQHIESIIQSAKQESSDGRAATTKKALLQE